MGETPFHTFIDLVALDQQINKISKETASSDAQLKVLAQQKAQLDASLSDAKQRIHEMQKAVDAHELEMNALDVQEKAKKQQLENLSSHKEYSSLKGEIDFLKKKQHSLEDTLVAVWQDLENAKKEYAQRQEQYEQKMAVIQAESAAIEEKKKTLHDQYTQQTAQREPLQAQVPSEWTAKYAAMRTKVADPVVAVVNGTCSACYYPASDQDMIELNHRRLVQCKDCFRLLYLPAAQEKALQ
ncbi:MAG TPA: hypothetical protein VIJ14_03260 [Rhabdochlamydiaceae bacterium]